LEDAIEDDSRRKMIGVLEVLVMEWIGLEASGVRNRSQRGGAGKRRDARGGARYWGRSGERAGWPGVW
jgi:hypothetical protein